MLNDTTQLFFPASGIVAVPVLLTPQIVRCHAAGPGGRPLTVLIDTGTDPSAIDLGLARRLGLRVGDFALGQGAASDAVPFTETVLPWLRIGDLTLRDLYLLAVDLSAMPFPVDLVLGYNVLPKCILHIDYAQQRVVLRHPDLGPPLPSPLGSSMPLAFFEHFPALHNLVINDTLTIPLATIDTGSNGGITLGPDLAAQLELHPSTAEVERVRGDGFGGGGEVLRWHAAKLRLGPFELANIALDVLASSSGDLGRHGRANLGNCILGRFASITLDYERQVCVIEPLI